MNEMLEKLVTVLIENNVTNRDGYRKLSKEVKGDLGSSPESKLKMTWTEIFNTVRERSQVIVAEIVEPTIAHVEIVEVSTPVTNTIVPETEVMEVPLEVTTEVTATVAAPKSKYADTFTMNISAITRDMDPNYLERLKSDIPNIIELTTVENDTKTDFTITVKIDIPNRKLKTDSILEQVLYPVASKAIYGRKAMTPVVAKRVAELIVG